MNKLSTFKLRIAAIATTLVAGAGLAAAAGPARTDRPARTDAQLREHQERHARRLAEFDRDRDGKLDHGERAAMRATMRAKRLAEFDRDRDGKLDHGERAAMRAKREAKAR